MIDTHCHLTFPEYEGRIDRVLDDARDAGVRGAITVSTTTDDCIRALAIACEHKNVWCTSGVHPLYADRGPHEWGNLGHVASHERCVAWGELGLDNHYNKPVQDIQRAVLAEQLAYIEGKIKENSRYDKPVVLHCRKAFTDLVPFLRESAISPGRFVFHCFTGTPGDMRLLLDFGAMVSFTGVVTYKNAPEVREAALLAPPDRIMVETDSPYLSPEPHRKERPNEPKRAMVTARFLAELRKEPWEEFHKAIDANTERFYRVRASGS